jgi:hypothetical protein
MKPHSYDLYMQISQTKVISPENVSLPRSSHASTIFLPPTPNPYPIVDTSREFIKSCYRHIEFATPANGKALRAEVWNGAILSVPIKVNVLVNP